MSKKGLYYFAKEHYLRGLFREDFLEWVRENSHVFYDFCELADQLWAKGFKHYSSQSIVGVMRFHHDVSEVGGAFKINAKRTPDIGRLYILLHPDRVDMFEYRRDDDFKEYVKSLKED